MPRFQRLLAEVHAPDIVVLPKGGRKTLDLDVLAQVHNKGDEPYAVGAHHPDEVHFWQLLDADHRELQRASPPKAKAARKAAGPLDFCSQHVLGGHAHSETRTIRLDAGKLKPGRRYFLRYRFWGETGETEFHVVSAADAPAGTARAAAAKAAPRKSPARSKAPAAKAARRRPAK